MTRLRGDQFQNVINTMRALGGKEKAKETASTTTGRIAVLPLEPISSLPMIVNVRDFSPTSIGFEMRKAPAVGSKLLICLMGEQRGRGIVCSITRWFPISALSCYVSATYAGEMKLPIAADEIEQTIAAEELRACADAAGA